MHVIQLDYKKQQNKIYNEQQQFAKLEKQYRGKTINMKSLRNNKKYGIHQTEQTTNVTKL